MENQDWKAMLGKAFNIELDSTTTKEEETHEKLNALEQQGQQNNRHNP